MQHQVVDIFCTPTGNIVNVLKINAGEGAHPARAPPKIGKNMIFWRKIVIFSHEIPQKCSRLPPLGPILILDPPLYLICI